MFSLLTGVLHAQPGSLDPTLDPGTGLNAEVQAVAVQPDGRILIAGNTFVNGNSEFGVLRMLEDGDLDLSFNTDGYTTTTLSALGDAAFDMALQPDGKIILAGQSDNGSGGAI